MSAENQPSNDPETVMRRILMNEVAQLVQAARIRNHLRRMRRVNDILETTTAEIIATMTLLEACTDIIRGDTDE